MTDFDSCGHESAVGRSTHSKCHRCGGIRTDSLWGIASGKWFKDLATARFYRRNGRLPEPVALPAPNAIRGDLPAAQDGDWEVRADGKRVRKDRWETGFRNIVTALLGPRTEFEIADIVERVRELASGPNLTATSAWPGGGIVGELVEMGDDEDGNPRLVIAATREAIRDCGLLMFRSVQVSNIVATPNAIRGDKDHREFLGKLVRMEWMVWAREQPNPKPSWLQPWDALTEPEREVDRRIGERIYNMASGCMDQTDNAIRGDKGAEAVLSQRVLNLEHFLGRIFAAQRINERGEYSGWKISGPGSLNEVVEEARLYLDCPLMPAPTQAAAKDPQPVPTLSAEHPLVRIVCAAVRYTDGTIIAGARHFDSVMRPHVIHRSPPEFVEVKGYVPERPEQGFIDQNGLFYNRRDAWIIAEENGQIIRRCGNDGLDGAGLFSENLY